MLTRETFKKVATVLGRIADPQIKRFLVREFAEMFQECNPRFDRVRFEAACFGLCDSVTKG